MLEKYYKIRIVYILLLYLPNKTNKMLTINNNENLTSLNITSYLSAINKSKVNNSNIGSDSYLDVLSSLNKVLDTWIYEIQKINDYVETNFPKTKEDAENLLANLLQLYGGLKIAVNSFNDKDLKKAHGSRVLKIEEELTQIEEYINDLEVFVINRDSSLTELDALLNENA